MTFLLVVSPDVAVTRQPGDGDEYVKTRANEVLSFSKNKSSNMEIIDAHQSIENVQKSLKEIIWNCI
jgi:thymidylate kinase